MSVAGDLVTALEDAMLGVPVAPPGASVGVLPRIGVIPAEDSPGTGGRYLVHGYDVTVFVPRDNTVTQLERLEELSTATYAALVAAGYATGTRFRYDGGDAEDVQYLSRVFPVAAPGEVFC